MMKGNHLKLRRLTLGTQLFAGITLLTASYLTTDQGWSNELVNAAIPTAQPATKIEVTTLSTDQSCY